MIYNQLIAEKRRLEIQINTIQTELKTLPQGNFYCIRNGNYTKWMYNDGSGQKNIRKNNQILAEELTAAKYLTLKLKDLQHELENLNSYINQYTNMSSFTDSFISSNSEYSRLLQKHFEKKHSALHAWMIEEYNTNPQHPENLIHQTTSGIFVRSKSESIIAAALYSNQIPFRYECELILGHYTIYPDFTIRHPQTGEIFYWEHFGLMEDSTYIQKACSRQQMYASHGIIPSVNLITTFETTQSPLSAKYVEVLINHYFL